MQYMRLLLVPLNDTEYDYSSIAHFADSYGSNSYDYSSIAHFADSYGSNSSEPTFHLKKLTDKRVKLTGQEIRPTFLDLEWLYRAYCKNKFKPTVKCEKGFPKSDGSDYYNNRLCPYPFRGAFPLPTKQQFIFNALLNCTVEITVPNDKRIRIHVETVNCTNNNPCFEDDCLQIKYRPTMTNTALCLCGTLKNLTLRTLSNKALIQYKGKHEDDYAIVSYWLDK
uniref:Astacin domain-containing protein n=1 Tax=Strongyloides papillosus TaxID=174720 RepID=A0A0N5B5F5_STREA